MTGSTIYNATDGPLTIDRAGRMIAAHETRPGVDGVDGSPLSGHIEAERIVVIEQTSTDEADTDEAPEPAPSTSTRTRKGSASTSSQEG